jgi:hypothetical protein
LQQYKYVEVVTADTAPLTRAHRSYHYSRVATSDTGTVTTTVREAATTADIGVPDFGQNNAMNAYRFLYSIAVNNQPRKIITTCTRYTRY